MSSINALSDLTSGLHQVLMMFNTADKDFNMCAAINRLINTNGKTGRYFHGNTFLFVTEIIHLYTLFSVYGWSISFSRI